MESPVPVSPSLAPTVETIELRTPKAGPPERLLTMSGLAVLVAVLAALAAQFLTRLIGFITNLAFYSKFSDHFTSPAANHLGWAVIPIPIIGGLIVGLMARFGSSAIRGHGIPEAMEQVLLNESRIPPRITFLKPISAAIAIGTGGPFGAEGPIIATGGALGSLVGQIRRTTSNERKVLLAAGAAAGMAATFGTPVSAVLLAVELLLFEYSPRSIIPVSLASATATGIRAAFMGTDPVFTMPAVPQPDGVSLAIYVALGFFMGFVAVAFSRTLYWIEDRFEHLPIHWMWWPAIGAVAVGIIGWISPDTLGVGYVNIDHILSGSIVGPALLLLVVAKLVSWEIALGSGTSGGTLAPLMTIGGGIGALAGALVHVDPRMAALVGMAAMFAGASHAVLASAVFAFEATRQPSGLLPVLAGCAAAYLVSIRLMPYSIMTEKLARRGTRVRPEMHSDYLERVLVRDIAAQEPVTLRADDGVEDVRDWIVARAPGSTHQGFPVLDARGEIIGVVTRRDLLDLELPLTAHVRDLVRRAPVVIYDDNSAREAADHMVREDVGRLPVVTRAAPRKVVAMLSRSDLLGAHRRRLAGSVAQEGMRPWTSPPEP